MKVSYAWLQNYFEQPLPSSEKLADLLTFSAFEIESVEQMGKDTVLDIKVLPDRARYALSHKGIAYEIGAALNLPQKQFPLSVVTSGTPITVRVEDSTACPRYMARKIEGITMAPSPDWLKASLEGVGQRSINSLVDAANLTLLDLGQPLHIFDADKIKGTIAVRFAKEGEKITTLDNKEVVLDPTILVIADDAGPLVIAGIKGGTRAEVTESTKNIIIESANFDAALIRKTSTKIGIRTDASKRYENALSPDTAAEGMLKVTSLIATINTPQSISEVTDMYPNPVKPWMLTTTSDYISHRLGLTLDEKTISDILNRLQLSHEVGGGTFTITIPTWRGDLTIAEDIVEEIGRIYGYDKLPSASLPPYSGNVVVNKNFYYIQKIKDILVDLGFSEVYTYAFVAKGIVELEKPPASDKKYLRDNLFSGINQSLELNARNADLLGLDQIRIFEIGNVFKENKEYIALSFGVKNIKKGLPKEGSIIRDTLKVLGEKLGIELKNSVDDKVMSYEMPLEPEIALLPEPSSYEINSSSGELKTFKPFSVYPFSVRDIAVFTPAGTSEKEVRTIIEKESGSLLVKNRLFDEFSKGDKTSYAFRMVFQSYEKTLTEDEINSIMNAITTTMNAKEGWQVR